MKKLLLAAFAAMLLSACDLVREAENTDGLTDGLTESTANPAEQLNWVGFIEKETLVIET